MAKKKKKIRTYKAIYGDNSIVELLCCPFCGGEPAIFGSKKVNEASQVERFQNKEDKPYNEISGAVALFCTSVYDAATIATTNAAHHPNIGNLLLLVIRGEKLMALVGELYTRAANEA